MLKFCVIYVRLSQDRAALGLGVERQLEDARALAKRRGWVVVAELVDNDMTGKGTVVRPGFESLVAMIEAGEIQVVVAWTWERLERNRREGLRLIEAGQAASLVISLCRGSDIDMSTPAGRLVADVLSATARNEIEVKSDRQRRAMEQRLQRGERWGGRRPFGYTTRMEPIEAEAEAVRDGYQMLLAGATLASIAREWNARGFTTPQPPRGTPTDTPHGPWRQGSMRKCLAKACYGGLRSHKGVIVGEAAWPGLIDRPTWEAAQHVLAGRPRGAVSGRYLLTGIAICGVEGCGATVNVGGRDRGLGAVYRCSRSAHMTQDLGRIETYVEAMMLARLRRPGVARILAPEAPDLGPLRREAEQLRGRRDALADDLALDEVTLARRARAITSRLDEIAAEEATVARTSQIATLASSTDVGAAWLASDTDTRRAAVDALFVVELLPPGRGVRTFRPETVRVTPKGQRAERSATSTSIVRASEESRGQSTRKRVKPGSS